VRPFIWSFIFRQLLRVRKPLWLPNTSAPGFSCCRRSPGRSPWPRRRPGNRPRSAPLPFSIAGALAPKPSENIPETSGSRLPETVVLFSSVFRPPISFCFSPLPLSFPKPCPFPSVLWSPTSDLCPPSSDLRPPTSALRPLFSALCSLSSDLWPLTSVL